MATGEKIKRYRHTMGLRQEDLARLVGVSRVHIYSVEHGRVSPSLTLMKKLAEVLQVPISYLTDEDIDLEFGVENAIRRDPLLNTIQKDMLLAAYHAAVKSSQPPPPKGGGL